jgi:hypothetical protein
MRGVTTTWSITYNRHSDNCNIFYNTGHILQCFNLLGHAL